MTKRPCLDCGADISTRGRTAQYCRTCATKRQRESCRRWRHANMERERVRGRLYHQLNKAKVLERNRSYRELHLDKLRKKCREYRESNLEKERERLRVYQRNYRALNPGKAREAVKQSYVLYREKYRETQKEYYLKNLEKHKQRDRDYRNTHPEKIRERNRRSRAKKRNQMGVVSKNIEALLLDRQGHHCAASWCRKKLNRRSDWHLDHIVPLKLGGLHDDANLQILCASCNLKKNAQSPDEWQKEHGRLPLLNTGDNI